MNAFGLPGVVVVQEQLWLLRQERFAVLAVAVLCASRTADYLLGRYTVGRFRVHAHEVLPAARDDVGPVAAGAQVLQQFQHRQIGELGVELLPPRMLR